MPANQSGEHPGDDVIDAFVRGQHGADPAGFDAERFAANRHAALFLVGSVFLDHFKSLYRIFEGDLVMALVMAEIWHFNLGRYFARAGIADATPVLSDDAARRDELTGCNAYSISQTLGVPSETVRRKVRKLMAAGLVEDGNAGGLITTVRLEDLFSEQMTQRDVRQFLTAAKMISGLVEPR